MFKMFYFVLKIIRKEIFIIKYMIHQFRKSNKDTNQKNISKSLNM
jgi:hypothetical protein